MNSINQCNGCKLGTSFCIYTKTILTTNQYGKEQYEVPGTFRDKNQHISHCILKNEDDYAIFPDTEEVYYAEKCGLNNAVIESVVLQKFRECEWRDPDSIEIFNSNLYLWESVTTNITTGDTFEVDGHRFEYDHPLYHIIDYNVPINTSGIVSLTERCNVMGKENVFLVSRGWAIDDGGEEAKKAIGIPQVRNCDQFLYGTMDKNTGIIMHKSMKDWTAKVHTFINFTNQKVNKYPPAKFNIFINDFENIDKYIRSIISHPTAIKNLYEAFTLIKKGAYINLYQLLLNNDIDAKTTRLITNNISTKNPYEIYKNNEGYRYNIHKVEKLYFDIITDKIKIRFGKKIILANIINYILNDKDLLNHNVGEMKKYDLYVSWYDEIAPTLDIQLADDLHPSRVKFNEYTSDNNSKSAINVIVNAIYSQKLLKADKLPKEFKDLFARHKEYIKNYEEPKDIFEIGAAVLDIKEFLKPVDMNVYNSFKKMLIHLDKITPIELKELWDVYLLANKNENPSEFWNYVENLALELSIPHQLLMALYNGEDEFNIVDIEPRHEPYIKVKQKRYYNKENQYREHQKMIDPMGETIYDEENTEDEIIDEGEI